MAQDTPGDPIDTGPGGFGIDGETYAYDVGVPDAEGGSQGPRATRVDASKATTDDAGRPKDLSAPTRTRLGQYLSQVTEAQQGSSRLPNRYPVDPNVVASSTSDANGYPAAIPAQPRNASSFAGALGSYLSDDAVALRATTKKGKARANVPDGNDLLAGLPGDSTLVSRPGSLTGDPSASPAPVSGHPNTTGVVAPYVSSVLSRNRFTNAASSWAPTDAGDPTPSFNPALAPQSILGLHDPQVPTVTMGRLASVGPLLTLRASQELNSSQPGADPNSAGSQAAALLPSLSQLGSSRIDQAMLQASDVLSGLTTDEVPDADVISPGSVSWGALNNVNDPFSGIDALGMLALSTALVSSLVLVIDGLSFVLSLITPQAKRPTHDAQGRYSLGEYLPGTRSANKQSSSGLGGIVAAVTSPGSVNVGGLLGIQPTNFPLSQALQVGTNAFFGIPQGTDVAGTLLGSLQSSADSPGFNVVVARTIIRSSASITDQLKRIGGNPINAIDQTLALVDVLRSSKAIAAINVFAQLGDAVLSQPQSFVDPDSNATKVSALDAMPDVVGGAVGKSRLRGTLKLAWASNTAPANLLLPASILGASAVVNGLGQFDPYVGVRQDRYSRVQATVTTKDDYGRIDPDVAATFEAQFDAEYVPFYFHDVRTNEMVSFHAFLASLTDGYAAAYEKSGGVGRVEQVKIYKETERKIAMSFYVAATSPNDFDEMWLKLNKLVTMVYPQYTRGLTLLNQDKSYAFTQPFSQLPGAGPLIRIRLGDLLKSNYSQFALGRLFGLGNPDFTVNGQQFGDDSLYDQDALDDLAELIRQALATPDGETYYVAPGSYPQSDDTGGAFGVSLPSPSVPGITTNQSPQFAPVFQSHAAQGASLFVVEAIRQSPDGSGMMLCEVRFNDDPEFLEAFGSVMARADSVYNDTDNPLSRYVGGRYLIPVTALTPTTGTKRRLVQQAFVGGSSFAQELSTFLSPNGNGANALAKSFKDTGGKGLAGFIETMDFDWLEKGTWETQLGRTAPKFCKVNIGFSPIHDISPGLDHLGFNRAPLYPIGLMNPQTSQARR